MALEDFDPAVAGTTEILISSKPARGAHVRLAEWARRRLELLCAPYVGSFSRASTAQDRPGSARRRTIQMMPASLSFSSLRGPYPMYLR
jgi:hypothetical protein